LPPVLHGVNLVYYLYEGKRGLESIQYSDHRSAL